jgi:hypothetical protein
MIPSKKAVLLLVRSVLLVWILGCGSTSITPPNGFLYSANSFRPGSVAALAITVGALAHITGTPFATNGNAPYSIVVSPPALPSPASPAAGKFLYAGIPATPQG